MRKIVGGHTLLDAGKFRDLLGGVSLCNGHELDEGRVVVLGDQLAEQLLEVAVLEAGLHVCELLLVVEVRHGVIIIVEPARHGGYRVCDAVGDAPLALAQGELGLCQRGAELVRGDALQRELGAGRLHQLAELLGNALLGALEDEQGHGLEQAVDEGDGEVLAESGVEHAALERCLVGAAEGVHEDIGREHALALGRSSDDVGQRHARILGCGCHLDAA